MHAIHHRYAEIDGQQLFYREAGAVGAPALVLLHGFPTSSVMVAAADESRRRIQRDLHDGVQQRLATLVLELRAAAGNAIAGRDELRDELARAESAVRDALEELREVSRGIHPAALTEGGLSPALRTLGRRSAIPVHLDISISGRFPQHVEVTAYYVVSELLTNVAKHARASVVHVAVEHGNEALHLSIRDDGVGGADPARGSGLTGLRDRVEAIGGTIAVDSPAGAGTAVRVALPLRCSDAPVVTATSSDPADIASEFIRA